MSNPYPVPENAEVSVHSVQWVIQSRANPDKPWRTEGDPLPGMRGEFEEVARRHLRNYRRMRVGREVRLVRQTIVCRDEPMEG